MSTYQIPIVRVHLVREGSLRIPSQQVNNPGIVAEIVTRYLEGVDREHLVALYLDGKNKVLNIHTVSVGTASGSMAHCREIFKPAILCGAVGLVLGHNHPGGSTEPSPEDRLVTNIVKEAGKLLGIPLLDHIIVTDNSARYFSFKEEGVL